MSDWTDTVMRLDEAKATEHWAAPGSAFDVWIQAVLKEQARRTWNAAIVARFGAPAAEPLRELQARVQAWTLSNFGEGSPSHLALLKAMEELGELAHHYLGRKEHRNGLAEVDHDEGVADSVADVVIALTVFCVREGLDMADTVNRVWDEVEKRTFTIRDAATAHDQEAPR